LIDERVEVVNFFYQPSTKQGLMMNSYVTTNQHAVFSSEPELIADLQEPQRLMESGKTMQLLNRQNPCEPFNIYGFYAEQNPQYKSLIDSFFQESGITPQLASMYPDAAHEVALMQLHPLPRSILSRTAPVDCPQISESAMWWMQTYGPHNSRLVCFEKCIAVAQKIISRFEKTVPPFQRCYRRLIPTLLSKSSFHSLSHALVDAYSIFEELNGYNDEMNSMRREETSSTSAGIPTATTTTDEHYDNPPINPTLNESNQSIPDEIIANNEDTTYHSELSGTHGTTTQLQENNEHEPVVEGIHHEKDSRTTSTRMRTRSHSRPLLSCDPSLPKKREVAHKATSSTNQKLRKATSSSKTKQKYTISTSVENEWKQCLFPIQKMLQDDYQSKLSQCKPQLHQSQNYPGHTSQYVRMASTEAMEFILPPSMEEDEYDDPILREFLFLLEELPIFIQCYVPKENIDQKYDQHCTLVLDETQRTLVMIDGDKYEFYLHDTADEDLPLLFDSVILDPFLRYQNAKKDKELYFQSFSIFWNYLFQYITKSYRCEPTPYKIHSVSLLLDYPGSSEVRQWSHIDGEENCYQGSVLCGNGITVTMEFSRFNPTCSTVDDLKQIWVFCQNKALPFLP
jgi:hypothetical protein